MTSEYVDDGIGTVFRSVAGTSVIYRMTGEELYIRAVIHSDAPPYFIYDDGNPFERKAWTQPVGWRMEE